MALGERLFQLDPPPEAPGEGLNGTQLSQGEGANGAVAPALRARGPRNLLWVHKIISILKAKVKACLLI